MSDRKFERPNCPVCGKPIRLGTGNSPGGAYIRFVCDGHVDETIYGDYTSDLEKLDNFIEYVKSRKWDNP